MLISQFLLTRPSRDVTYPQTRLDMIYNISTHTPLAGRDGDITVNGFPESISTHTPLAGRDMYYIISSDTDRNFYSHAPRGT